MTYLAYQREIYAGGQSGRRPRRPVGWGELERRAAELLQPGPWGYIAGGAGREATERANRAALDDVQIVPRMMRDVSVRSLRRSRLGLELDAPGSAGADRRADARPPGRRAGQREERRRRCGCRSWPALRRPTPSRRSPRPAGRARAGISCTGRAAAIWPRVSSAALRTRATPRWWSRWIPGCLAGGRATWPRRSCRSCGARARPTTCRIRCSVPPWRYRRRRRPPGRDRLLPAPVRQPGGHLGRGPRHQAARLRPRRSAVCCRRCAARAVVGCVNIYGADGRYVRPNYALGAANAATLHLTKHVAETEARHGISAVAVNPGPFLTGPAGDLHPGHRGLIGEERRGAPGRLPGHVAARSPARRRGGRTDRRSVLLEGHRGLLGFGGADRRCLTTRDLLRAQPVGWRQASHSSMRTDAYAHGFVFPPRPRQNHMTY